MNAAELPLYYNAINILERNLPTRAGKVALYSAERNMTFREVSDEVNQVGNGLKRLGMRFGDYVAILALDGPEWVTTFFAATKIGAIAVGLNTLLKPHEYAYMLRDCRARVLVIHEMLLPQLASIRGDLPFLEHGIVIGSKAPAGAITYRALIDGQPTALAAEQTHRDDFCSLN